MSIQDAQVNEPQSGTTNMIFTVTLSAAPTPEVLRVREWRGKNEGQILTELIQLLSLPNVAANPADNIPAMAPATAGRAGAPVVGFIDQSYAPDLRDLLETLDADWRPKSVFDAQILRAADDEEPATRSSSERNGSLHNTVRCA